MMKKILALVGLLNLIIFFSVFKNPRKKQRELSYDCGLVCGYPANGDGSPSLIMKSRVEMGIELYQKGKIKKLLFSGGAVQNKYVEAKVMAKYAINHGVDAKDIIIEGKSRSTYHNLKNCQEVLMKHEIKTCLIITNTWHLRKADHYARKFNYHYAMVAALPPRSFSRFKIIYLHIKTNLVMYRNLFKGLS